MLSSQSATRRPLEPAARREAGACAAATQRDPGRQRSRVVVLGVGQTATAIAATWRALLATCPRSAG